MTVSKPSNKPGNSRFSSGPTSKRPGWSLANLNTNSLGRSHRAGYPKERLQKVIEESRRILGMPDDYLLGIVPASNTGAFEMAMWSMLGQRPVDVFSWESFGAGWVTDIRMLLPPADVREITAPYGELPDFSQADLAHRDLVFLWNGTTSGVCLANADWVPAEREGLALCDATSAVFAMEIDWPKLDVVTWSWQKVLGGEAAHGMLALSPRAVARLESYTPPRPLPKIFRLVKKGQLDAALFDGSTINTPSMLAVEDQLDALAWADQAGGLAGLIERSRRNLDVIAGWVKASDWVDFLAKDPACRSSTSICLSITDTWFASRPEDEQRTFIKQLTGLLESEGVALDISGYRDAPPGLRIWGGATVETDDIRLLLPWLDWAYGALKNQPSQASA